MDSEYKVLFESEYELNKLNTTNYLHSGFSSGSFQTADNVHSQSEQS